VVGTRQSEEGNKQRHNPTHLTPKWLHAVQKHNERQKKKREEINLEKTSKGTKPRTEKTSSSKNTVCCGNNVQRESWDQKKKSAMSRNKEKI